MRFKYGGEGGIRTLDTVLSVYPLSRRAPSAVSATSPKLLYQKCFSLKAVQRYEYILNLQEFSQKKITNIISKE